MNRIFLGATALILAIPAMAQVAPSPPQMAPSMTPRMEATHTRDEAVAKVRAHFAMMDINRDGFVAGDEMKLANRHHGKSEEARKERHEQSAFEWLDRNRDNMISRGEFSSFRAARGQSAGARGTAPMAMPGDRPGGRMQGMGGWGGPGKGSGMMRMADLDRDGRVSLQEATTSVLQRFDRVDTNRDGRITPDERKQQREQHKAMRGQRAS